ncbi:low molecular weight protein-tyrosine-phosphatase [Marinomonas pollencensis]|uniref:protein-tyrosine-phosphatase n=1 Tax=Marinomonas pollencensis TaxID=491954 RepID=A0A3E0DRJ1_9GAMM|nr:low molecular weight protein-tyrosine-phosphatase [Marinomonas pollencensis]REG85767.1 protein tyrosine phosphatase [Marinomonas pollencensis]
MKTIKVLTVCLGNICRSPAAQGILAFTASQYKGLKLEVDSAGTAVFHVGNSPDPRSIRALAEQGIDISMQQARQVKEEDFQQFDWIVAMDAANLANLKAIQPAQSQAKLVMFGAYQTGVSLGEVADPYYGQEDGFIRMREHLTVISEHFIDHLMSHD